MESAVASVDLTVYNLVVSSFLKEIYVPFRRFVAQYRQYAQSELLMKLSSYDLVSLLDVNNFNSAKNEVFLQDQISVSNDGQHLVESVLDPVCQEAILVMI